MLNIERILTFNPISLNIFSFSLAEDSTDNRVTVLLDDQETVLLIYDNQIPEVRMRTSIFLSTRFVTIHNSILLVIGALGPDVACRF